LVANAGVSKSANISGHGRGGFRPPFRSQHAVAFFLIQQTLPLLVEGSGMVFVSSLAVHAVVGTIAAYAATKGAIDTLVKHFAAALGPRGIGVNAVAPGVVDTDMSNFARTETGQKFTLG
jgi:3-oxoacyl-[acyl-carrier protein] reductase